MAKIAMGEQGRVLPMPVAIIGSNVDGKPNFMTAAWVSRVFMDPPLIGVAINRNHYTWKGIDQTNTFSVNFPGADLVKEADYCGLYSGHKVDKSTLFDVFFGKLKTAPMIEQCPLCFECEMVEAEFKSSKSLVIGRIVESYTEERFLTDGIIDPKKVNPIMLTSPDKHYWTLGEIVADAYAVGHELKEKK